MIAFLLILFFYHFLFQTDQCDESVDELMLAPLQNIEAQRYDHKPITRQSHTSPNQRTSIS